MLSFPGNSYTLVATQSSSIESCLPFPLFHNSVMCAWAQKNWSSLEVVLSIEPFNAWIYSLNQQFCIDIWTQFLQLLTSCFELHWADYSWAYLGLCSGNAYHRYLTYIRTGHKTFNFSRRRNPAQSSNKSVTSFITSSFSFFPHQYHMSYYNLYYSQYLQWRHRPS